MSLNGVVSSTSVALSDGLSPALVMREDFFSLSPGDPGTAHFIQGEVEGTFPNAFSMRVYDPPPASTLDALFEGEPAFGVGWLVAIGPEHPPWLRTEETQDGGVEHAEICYESQCLSGVRECGDDAWDPSSDWPCGGSFPDELPWETYGQVANKSVIYFADSVPAGSVIAQLYNGGEAIGAGYHLFVTEETEFDACAERAWARTLADLNELQGTQLTEWPLDREHVRIGRKLYDLAWLAEGCPRKYQLVDSSEDQPVELQFLDEPSLGFYL